MISAGSVGVVSPREKRLKIFLGVTIAIWLAIKDSSKSVYVIEIGVNSIIFFTRKFLPGLALVPGLELLVG